MVKRTVEGSTAVAEAVKNCEPDVCACYPITPSSHIAEKLSEYYADGELKEYITTEAEFTSISACVGASAAGGRAFSATSSQGLALMHEVVYAAAGMRLPIVLAIGNRSLSAPLGIWCDHQDTIAERDSGWIQLYCESNQEMVDTMPQAFKIAEKNKLPAMVCMDGFYLTHAFEPIEVPSVEEIRKYLPKYDPELKLDPENPETLGVYAFPEHYQDFREDVHNDLMATKEDIIQEDKAYEKMFGRGYSGLYEKYNADDADHVIIAMGSITGNTKVAVDNLREKGEKVGLIRIRSFRPFPTDELANDLEGKETIGVFDKSYSFGSKSPLYMEVLASAVQSDTSATISSFIGGIGGRDKTVEDMENLFKRIMKGKKEEVWV